MLLKFTSRILRETSPTLLMNFITKFGLRGVSAVSKFNKRVKKGIYFPAFIFISITDRCNLSCQGCWVTASDPSREINEDQLDRIIEEGKKNGVYTYGILGGEPLLHKDLISVFRKHKECYFILFTNGTLLSEDITESLRRCGNVTPLISIEGNEVVSDVRRGGKEVFSRTIEGLKNCTSSKLITGVATSVCKSNFDDLVNTDFINRLIELKAHYLWYYIYRPVGPVPSPELTLSEEEILKLRRFMVDIRSRVPIMVVDSYWDHKGNAMCPADTGISHHIGPGGYIEPCPPIQFAKDNIEDNRGDLFRTFTESEFLKDFRKHSSEDSRGCIIMDNPELLAEIVTRNSAINTGGRVGGTSEVLSVPPCCSHNIPGSEIPETFWPYRLAKKYWFFGFGAYG